MCDASVLAFKLRAKKFIENIGICDYCSLSCQDCQHPIGAHYNVIDDPHEHCRYTSDCSCDRYCTHDSLFDYSKYHEVTYEEKGE